MSPIETSLNETALIRVHLRARHLRGLELLSNGGESERPLLSPQLCLVFCDDGGGMVAPGRQPFEQLAPGQLLARAPAQVLPFVQAANGQRARCRLILVDADLLALLGGGEAPRLPRFHSLLLDAPALVASARALWDAVERDESPAEQQHLLRCLVAPVLDAFTAQLSRSAPLTAAVSRARDLLHERFADELRLDGIARVVAMSKCHLVHLFHKEVGLPPHAYQIQLRVAHARRLVAAGTPIAEVASLTGFADQSHLTRLFKRIVGLPPGQYAASTQALPPPIELPVPALS
jgi:AraC-like DNA-binding protein